MLECKRLRGKNAKMQVGDGRGGIGTTFTGEFATNAALHFQADHPNATSAHYNLFKYRMIMTMIMILLKRYLTDAQKVESSLTATARAASEALWLVRLPSSSFIDIFVIIIDIFVIIIIGIFVIIIKSISLIIIFTRWNQRWQRWRYRSGRSDRIWIQPELAGRPWCHCSARRQRPGKILFYNIIHRFFVIVS